MHFELIFKGETSPRVTLEQGQAALARLFKLDIKQSAHQQKLSKLFSGSSIVIKKDLSDEAAQQIKAKLAKLGLICHIRTSKTNSASPAAPTVANPDTESGFQGFS